jgi:hypothetical protein
MEVVQVVENCTAILQFADSIATLEQKKVASTIYLNAKHSTATKNNREKSNEKLSPLTPHAELPSEMSNPGAPTKAFSEYEIRFAASIRSFIYRAKAL